MSANKTCNEFQKFTGKITEEKIAKIIGKTLRDNFPNSKSGISSISRKTDIDSRSIWNWYNGLYAPNLLNFIMLCQKLPFLIRIFLELCNRSEIWNEYYIKINSPELTNNLSKTLKNDKFYTVIFDGIKSEYLKTLNQRQLWFLENLVSGNNVKRSDIIKFWQVSSSAAERDIGGLVKLGQIKFVGSNKAGKYIINF